MEPQPNRKSPRKRRRKLLPILSFVMAAILLAWFFESQMPTTILFVRHADTETRFVDQDPPLSERGRLRAELLADVLQDIDVVAGVDAIYASEYLSTQETAAPLAERLGLPVYVANPYEVEPFMERVLREQKGKIVLVVTHRDIMARLIEELHGSKNVPQIAEDEYHNVYIVTRPRFGKVKTLRLHYGVPWPLPHDLPRSQLPTDSL